MGTSAPVRLATNTLFTQGLSATALSTTVFKSMHFPPLTIWSAVMTVPAFAILKKSKTLLKIQLLVGSFTSIRGNLFFQLIPFVNKFLSHFYYY